LCETRGAHCIARQFRDKAKKNETNHDLRVTYPVTAGVCSVSSSRPADDCWGADAIFPRVIAELEIFLGEFLKCGMLLAGESATALLAFFHFWLAFPAHCDFPTAENTPFTRIGLLG